MAAAAAAAKVGVALVILVLAVLGPAVGLLPVLDEGRSKCFKGWDALLPRPLGPLVGSLVCSIFDNPFGAPKAPPTSGKLKENFYAQKCPRAEELVYNAVVAGTRAENRSVGAGLIRLHFHDAFVRGCDASVLLDKTATGNTDTEKTGLPNANSLRGFEVIDAAKAAVEKECAGVVSCADILAFAARDAAYILSDKKISYKAEGGRCDGTVSNAAETNRLPGPDSDVDDLKLSFASQGLSAEDMATLSGAHSVGDASCRFISGTRKSGMDPEYAKNLTDTCNAGGPDKRVDQDPETPLVLDNQYYKNIAKFVLFNSDATLITSSDTKGQVDENAADNAKWCTKFGKSMVNMGRIGVVTQPIAGSYEIRKVCSQVNQLQYPPPPPPQYTPPPPPPPPPQYNTPSPPPPGY